MLDLCGHLPVPQELKLHQILVDELLGLPKDEVSLSGVHPHLIQKFPDRLLSGAVAIHEDRAQEIHQETGLGESADTVHPPIFGQIHFADEEDIGMMWRIHFL